MANRLSTLIVVLMLASFIVTAPMGLVRRHEELNEPVVEMASKRTSASRTPSPAARTTPQKPPKKRRRTLLLAGA
jgi:hypothetical protein